jgi:hypothetical protein
MSFFDFLYDAGVLIFVAPGLVPPVPPAGQAFYAAARWGGSGAAVSQGVPGGARSNTSDRPPVRVK